MNTQDQIRYLRMLHPKEDWLKDAIEKLKALQAQEDALSKDEILELAKHIKPVMRVNVTISNENNPRLYWLDACNVAANSFQANPLREAEGLQEIAHITTYHRYQHFKFYINPSLKECILQCPPEIRDKVCAVEVFTSTSDISKIYDCRLDRQLLTTIYYAGELPEDIAAQKVKW